MVLSAHFSGALLARSLDPDGDPGEQHYQYAVLQTGSRSWKPPSS